MIENNKYKIKIIFHNGDALGLGMFIPLPIIDNYIFVKKLDEKIIQDFVIYHEIYHKLYYVRSNKIRYYFNLFNRKKRRIEERRATLFALKSLREDYKKFNINNFAMSLGFEQLDFLLNKHT